MQPRNSRNASAPDGGNIRALQLQRALGRGWRTPAAAHSTQRRAAQSGDGWQQLSSRILKYEAEALIACALIAYRADRFRSAGWARRPSLYCMNLHAVTVPVNWTSDLE